MTTQANATTALHRAKLRRPDAADHYVARLRLLELLDDTVRVPLVLVIAPAGAGKTTLVSAWTANSDVPTAWLSLDEDDGDMAQFWSGVVAALDTVVPGCGARALASLRREAPRHEAVDRLLEDLDGPPRPPAVLVIDDVQHVDGHDAIAASVARFIRHLPPWLHVVLLSRRDVALPADRMRSRGQLAEIRFADLRFSPDEATELLTALVPTLTTDEIAAAVERADGWAASLRFSALAARHGRTRPLSDRPDLDDDVLVNDYVWREVLARELGDVLDVLSAAALVARINPSLATAITRRPDAGDLLLVAEEHGLFLTRQGASGWFELHALVRQVLRADLAVRAPTTLAELHARAARWFEDADEAVAALDQWLLAGRPREALRLLATTHADLYDRGRDATVRRVIAAIPPAVVAGDLDAMVAYAWCHLLVDRRRFIDLVEEVAWWVDRSAVTGAVPTRLIVLRSWAAAIGGGWVRGGELARQATTELGDGWWKDPLGRSAWNMVAWELALSERWDDTSADVRHAELALSRDPERRLAFEGTRALGHALSGRPLDALRIAAGVRRRAEVSQLSTLRAELRLAEALAHRELGDRARARRELAELAGEPAETMLYCRILATLELARVQLDDGERAAALVSFDQAGALIESEGFGPDGRSWLVRVGTLLALAAGDLDGARSWADGDDDPFWRAVSLARIGLATGDAAGAIAAIDAAAPRCPRHEVVLGLLTARAVGQPDEAVKLATTAVEVAAAHGMLQTVASEGPEAIELVEHAAWRAPAGWMDRLRRTAAETASTPPLDARQLVEPLTERELAVLRLLPSRLTVREIADELYVSMNTVKFHLRVIYRKLGVNSRAEAAGIARRTSFTRR